MASGMFNRHVWEINNKYFMDTEMIQDRNNLVWQIEGSEYELKRLIKLNETINTESGDSLHSGTLYFNWEESTYNFNIQDDGTLDEEPFVSKRTSVIPFWISINQSKILFQKKGKSINAAINILSKAFFDKSNGFKNIEYDIDSFEREWRNGTYSMWAYSFKDRQGSVDKGSHFGDDIQGNDPIYQETVGTPKNYVGIILPFDGKEVKARITRSGSITLMGIQNTPENNLEFLNLLNSFNRFQI